ncbi:hypothetical protein K8R43_03515 [archaeon]|nr:hypothetical protein [archaeon]
MKRERHFKSYLAKGRELELVKIKTDITFSSQRGKGTFLKKCKKRYAYIKKDYNKLRKDLIEDGEPEIPKRWHEIEYEHNGSIESLNKLLSLSSKKGNERDAMTAINILRWMVQTEAKGHQLKGLTQAARNEKNRFREVERFKHVKDIGKLEELSKDAGLKKQDLPEFNRLVDKMIKEYDNSTHTLNKDKFIMKESNYHHNLQETMKKMAREEGWELKKRDIHLSVIKSRKSAFNELKRTMKNMTEEQKNHIVDFMISTGITEEGNRFVNSL